VTLTCAKANTHPPANGRLAESPLQHIGFGGQSPRTNNVLAAIQPGYRAEIRDNPCSYRDYRGLTPRLLSSLHKDQARPAGIDGERDRTPRCCKRGEAEDQGDDNFTGET
jgi:hypothetical protein